MVNQAQNSVSERLQTEQIAKVPMSFFGHTANCCRANNLNQSKSNSNACMCVALCVCACRQCNCISKVNNCLHCIRLQTQTESETCNKQFVLLLLVTFERKFKIAFGCMQKYWSKRLNLWFLPVQTQQQQQQQQLYGVHSISACLFSKLYERPTSKIFHFGLPI